MTAAAPAIAIDAQILSGSPTIAGARLSVDKDFGEVGKNPETS
jgi:uncharacterized protein (DUF433 family)